MKCAICGSNGKMGRMIVSAFSSEYTLFLINREQKLEDVLDEVDVVIDFTCASSAFEHGLLALKKQKPIIIGATGLTSTMQQILMDYAQRYACGCLYAPNFSCGAIWMVDAIKTLAQHFDGAEIKETHHISKLDVPSGTALRLKESLLAVNPSLHVRIMSERKYSRNVTHQLVFYKEGEELAISHVVSNKKAYLNALRIAMHKIVQEKGWVPYEAAFFQTVKETKVEIQKETL